MPQYKRLNKSFLGSVCAEGASPIQGFFSYSQLQLFLGNLYMVKPEVVIFSQCLQTKLKIHNYIARPSFCQNRALPGGKAEKSGGFTFSW